MGKVFQDDLFKGKAAFLTGGTSGIGLAIAQRFAGLGAKVALLGRNADKMEAAVESIRSAGGEACGAAAGNFPASAIGMSANGFKAVVDIDLLGTFNTSRAAYAHLRKPGASVVHISANHARLA